MKYTQILLGLKTKEKNNEKYVIEHQAWKGPILFLCTTLSPPPIS